MLARGDMDAYAADKPCWTEPQPWMADGGGMGVCKLAPRLLEQIMTGLWLFVSLNQVSAASIDLAHDGAAKCWLVYSGEDCNDARRSPGQ